MSSITNVTNQKLIQTLTGCQRQAHCFNSDARRQTVIVHCEWTIATAQNSGTITDWLYSFISNQLGTKLMGIVVIFSLRIVISYAGENPALLLL